MPIEQQDNPTVDSKPVPGGAAFEHPFKAVRCYAGDSISLAQDERGDVKAWGAFRVRAPSPFLPRYLRDVILTSFRACRTAKVSSASTRPHCASGSLRRSARSRSTLSCRSHAATTTT